MKNIIENQVKIYLSESIKSLNDFYVENNIDEDGLSYLGRGEFGEAYSIGDGRVLKKTSSKNEFNLAKKIENNNAPILDSIAKIYKTEIIDGQMFIILEELEEDSEIETLFYELLSVLEEQGLSIEYMGHLDLDEIEISNELNRFMDELDDIVRAYRYLEIDSPDISPENMGYSKEGKLKAFDVDDKRK